jgi:hypothetical protein
MIAVLYTPLLILSSVLALSTTTDISATTDIAETTGILLDDIIAESKSTKKFYRSYVYPKEISAAIIAKYESSMIEHVGKNTWTQMKSYMHEAYVWELVISICVNLKYVNIHEDTKTRHELRECNGKWTSALMRHIKPQDGMVSSDSDSSSSSSSDSSDSDSSSSDSSDSDSRDSDSSNSDGDTSDGSYTSDGGDYVRKQKETEENGNKQKAEEGHPKRPQEEAAELDVGEYVASSLAAAEVEAAENVARNVAEQARLFLAKNP